MALKTNDIVEFTRSKDFTFIKELSRGSFGRTVVLRDTELSIDFVCKKYEPHEGIEPKKYYGKFVDEIRYLYLLSHRNVVRVYNYYLYPKLDTGFILMEFIEGNSIDNYLSQNPQNINGLFEQCVEAFAYLEANSILHRDIRPTNILVENSGTLKVIDFGFGRSFAERETLTAGSMLEMNHWCDLPADIKNDIYDSKTEVYFIGKLFEQFVSEEYLDSFRYSDILRKMTPKGRSKRIENFASVLRLINSHEREIDLFSETEILCHQNFCEDLFSAIPNLSEDSSFERDIEKVIQKLSSFHREVMLHEFVPTNKDLIKIFIKGGYWFSKRNLVRVSSIREFLGILRGSSKDKQAILLDNIYTKLSTIETKVEEKKYGDFDLDDEIPF